jgi:hypothetical protein
MSRRAIAFLSKTGFPQSLICFSVAAVFLCSACASTSPQNQSKQYIRIDNENQSRVRAYVAFETSPTVRVYLGTVDPHQSEYFPLPGAVQGHRGLVVRCERGPLGRYLRQPEYFETAFVTLPGPSTLVVRVRDPIRYSDFTIFTPD